MRATYLAEVVPGLHGCQITLEAVHPKHDRQQTIYRAVVRAVLEGERIVGGHPSALDAYPDPFEAIDAAFVEVQFALRGAGLTRRTVAPPVAGPKAGRPTQPSIPGALQGKNRRSA